MRVPAPFLLVALPLIADAQTCTLPDGTWNLVPGESRLGSGLSFNPYLAITAVQLAVRIGPQQVTQQWHFTGPHLDRVAKYEFTTQRVRQDTRLDAPLDFEYSAISAQWQNCTLIVTGFGKLFGFEVITTDTYIVSPDGRALTILQYGTSPISVTDRSLVFRRSRLPIGASNTSHR